jgi:hypothetical protein
MEAKYQANYFRSSKTRKPTLTEGNTPGGEERSMLLRIAKMVMES